MAQPIPGKAAIQSQYKNRCSMFTSVGVEVQLLLPADTRRYYVEFWASTGAQDIQIGPAGSQNVLTLTFANPGWPLVYKWGDCPSFLTDEWYVLCAPGINIYIFECLYVGG